MKIDKRRKENSERKPWRDITSPALGQMREAARQSMALRGVPMTKNEHDLFIKQRGRD